MSIARLQAVAILAVASGLASCAGPVARPNPGHLGVGTTGVSAYVSGRDGDSLAGLQAACDRAQQPGARPAEGMQAACAQLRSTTANQPGNAVQPNPPR